MWSQTVQTIMAWANATPEQQLGLALFMGGTLLVVISLILKLRQTGAN